MVLCVWAEASQDIAQREKSDTSAIPFMPSPVPLTHRQPCDGFCWHQRPFFPLDFPRWA